ncbi:MAG: hypothetical protein JWR80_10031 [Bradyrhizobium sp.]|nr:hypothetical protein [Bradyrhizobium sp.]
MRVFAGLVVAIALAGCNQTSEDPAARAARVSAWMANQRAMDANAPPVYQMPENRPTNCTSVINGQTVTTSCGQ